MGSFMDHPRRESWVEAQDGEGVNQGDHRSCQGLPYIPGSSDLRWAFCLMRGLEMEAWLMWPSTPVSAPSLHTLSTSTCLEQALGSVLGGHREKTSP